jgi:VanZ family protein
MRHYLAIAAWILFAAIFIFTDGPLSLRPTTGLSPNVERFIGLVAVGLAFALAYPRRPLLALALLLLVVGIFEFIQQFIHNRHGTLHDAAVKYTGVIVGVAIGYIVNRLLAFDPVRR